MSESQQPDQLPEHITKDDKFFVTEDKTKIYYLVARPTTPAKGIVILFHGLGEHINRYHHVTTILNENGFVVKGIDIRGHGKTFYLNKDSTERSLPKMMKGHLENVAKRVFPDFLKLVNEVDVKEGDEKLPVFLFGHSMGGLLALYFAKQHGHALPNFKGIITSAPAVAPYYVPTWAYYASKLLGNGCLSRFQDTNKLDLKNLSRDPEVEVKYNADPFVHGLITLQTARDLLVYGEEMLEAANEFSYSILSLHGTEDKMTSFAANEKFMQRCGSTDKTFEPKKGFYHELHNEPSPMKEEVIQTYIKWMQERL